ncbi:bifunctional UDP-N-acetylglucosamine diphosphorylase/glucosamine-1-phosphate N-acetyltransferase GlmU [Phosphitispora sp. TUW77]|uniref:bifunctional UDP-N-acetylglucosamine diphosphorylase/glucosamine-1-phosphate N-acetyltransferase GlmU n=1 Tax=Phosphitispora sp. TUW77 TaxID=3152361 RepID=UPI003AB60923
MDVAAIILAAGKGTRMKSRLPKVLHGICGRPMLEHVICAALGAGISKNIVVVGHGAEMVKGSVKLDVTWVEQTEQLGTGHAVMQAEPLLTDFAGSILVLCGDTPLISPDTLKRLLNEHDESGNSVTVLTAVVEDPSGYGRIIRDSGGLVTRIVEHRDASADELKVNEINTGIYCFAAKALFAALQNISPANAQGEYYLTDVLSVIVDTGGGTGAVNVENALETIGINDRVQLAAAEALMRSKILMAHMTAGVTIIDPNTTYIGSEVMIGCDSVINPGTVIEGNCRFGENCILGPYSRLTDVIAGNAVMVQNSVIIDSSIGNGVTIGPFAYIRPGTVLGDNVKVGDFVEIKNSVVDKGSKVPHLSYIGDTHIGERVNVGAGTITCNYDGIRKWKTSIGNNAFIGSNTNLVAPVIVGENAIIGAGSTVTKNVPDGALCIERGEQKVYPEWATRKNKKK